MNERAWERQPRTSKSKNSYGHCLVWKSALFMGNDIHWQKKGSEIPKISFLPYFFHEHISVYIIVWALAHAMMPEYLRYKLHLLFKTRKQWMLEISWRAFHYINKEMYIMFSMGILSIAKKNVSQKPMSLKHLNAIAHIFCLNGCLFKDR